MKAFSDLELLALHVCIHSARFESSDLRSDLVDNPHLASAHARVVEEIRRRGDEPGSTFHGKEQEWRTFLASIDPILLSAAASRLTRHPDWSSLSEIKRIARLQQVLLPFDVDEAAAARALAESE